jgi:hypothetical protein
MPSQRERERHAELLTPVETSFSNSAGEAGRPAEERERETNQIWVGGDPSNAFKIRKRKGKRKRKRKTKAT